MSFAAKTDLVGIETTGLKLRANGHNASNSVLQIPGADGSIIGDEIYGHIKAPNCEYAITATATIDVDLGNVYNAPYALSKIHVSTGAGQEPVVTADGVQIEASATQSVCTYAVDEITVTPARHALTFGAFSYTESAALALQTSEFDASVQLTPTTVNGDPVASDSTAGVQTVDVTMWSSSEDVEPTVSVATGWHQTQDWNCTGADSSMFSWTAQFTKYLSADMA